MSALADKLKAAVTAMVQSLTAKMDYLALYPCRVVAQSGQTLDLQPEASKLPPFHGVPLRLGLPGVEVTVSPGARVLLGFENGNPSRPVATLWESGGLVELKLGVGATQQAVLGTAQKAALDTFLTALDAWVTLAQPIADPTGTGTTTFKGAVTALKAAGYLSSTVKVL